MRNRKKQNHITVGFIALGCPKAIVDSEKMLAEIAEAGLLITADTDNADVIVVNTCAFIEPAKEEAIQAIEYAVSCKRKGCVKKVIVTGCLTQRMGEEIFTQTEGIDAVIDLGRRDEIGEIIKKTIHSNSAAGKSPKAYLTKTPAKISDDRARLLITPSHSAYLRISEGCDHKCSFCTIPAIRGRFRSKPQANIIAEANELAHAGVVELNIIAQDTAYYGKDLKIKNALVTLLKELEKIETVKWLRLMYLYPAGFTDQLIDIIAESEKIVHYLDIPIQHINDKIIKNMHRPDSRDLICKLIEKLRAVMPDVILRTTLIVGFPGETDRQFDELLEFVKQTKFDALGAFKYYPEAGTDAADMPNQIPANIKQHRLDQLMTAQQRIAFAKNKSRIGSEITCLVDSIDCDAAATARFYGQAPDIDSVCIIKKCTAKTGQFIKTKITNTKNYDLIAEQL